MRIDELLQSNSDLFAPSTVLNFVLSIENFTSPNQNASDFRVGYNISMTYYDILPPSADINLFFDVNMNTTDKVLGSSENLGQIFIYNITVRP